MNRINKDIKYNDLMMHKRAKFQALKKRICSMYTADIILALILYRLDTYDTIKVDDPTLGIVFGLIFLVLVAVIAFVSMFKPRIEGFLILAVCFLVWSILTFSILSAICVVVNIVFYIKTREISKFKQSEGYSAFATRKVRK